MTDNWKKDLLIDNLKHDLRVTTDAYNALAEKLGTFGITVVCRNGKVTFYEDEKTSSAVG